MNIGIYRAEWSAEDGAYTNLYGVRIIISDGVYKFFDENDSFVAAYPVHHFIVINLEE